MLIKDHWYVVCASSRLSSREPRAFQVWDRRLVAFRDSNGEPNVLLDRCCHRGVRLSLGTMRNGCVACGYHGWEYDGTGSVVRIPSLGARSSPPKYRTPSFHATERDHYVWVWMPGEHEHPPAEPRLYGIDGGRWIQRSAVWNVNVMPAAENQLDSAHLPFAHRGIHPSRQFEGDMPGLVEGEFLTQVSADSVVSTWGVPRGSPPESTPGPRRPGHGFLSFELPYRNYVFLETERSRAIFNWVPLSRNTCRMEAMMSNRRGDSNRGLEVVFADNEPTVLEQDRTLLESAQHWFDEGNEAYERDVRADSAPLAARKLVHDALRGSVDREVRQYWHKCFV